MTVDFLTRRCEKTRSRPTSLAFLLLEAIWPICCTGVAATAAAGGGCSSKVEAQTGC